MSFIGVVMYIQAMLAAVAAIGLLIWRDDIVDFLDDQGAPLTDGTLTGTIVFEAVLAVALFVVASGIMRGSRSMRLMVAIVQGLSMTGAMFVLIAHHAGGFLYRGVFSLFVGIFVLWALYGNEESDRYFTS